MSVVPKVSLIALDLDGTLLDANDRISARNTAAIRHALDGGTRVALVTGRGVSEPARIARDLGLDMPVICCHGALTKDVRGNRTLAHMPLGRDHATALLSFAERKRLPAVIYTDETFVHITGSGEFVEEMIGTSYRSVKSFADVLQEEPTFIRFFGAEALETVRREFDGMPVHFRHESWGEMQELAITHADASKRNALLRLCADFQIPRENVMAIGDSRNDLPMLLWAGIGVAMGNAHDEVRRAVNHVTARHDEDGVALAIERFAIRAA